MCSELFFKKQKSFLSVVTSCKDSWFTLTWCCVRCMQIKRYRSRSGIGPVCCEAVETLDSFGIFCSGKHMLSAEVLVKAVKEVDRFLRTA
jgi:hypothetical protein